MKKDLIAIIVFLIFLTVAAIPAANPTLTKTRYSAQDTQATQEKQEKKEKQEKEEKEEKQETGEKDFDNLTLEELLNLEIKLAPRHDYWRMTVLLVLRIYGENLNFPHHKKEVRAATNVENFHIKLWTIHKLINQKKIDDYMFYPEDPVYYDMDFVFLHGNKLAKKYAANGNTLIFSDKRSCRYAAFIITLGADKKLKVRIREKNIKAQGAKFSREFLDSLKR